ncbi:MAG: NADH-quinone oxidoreductase subunit A [Raineya sp.]
MLTEFGKVLVFLIGGVLFLLAALFVSWLIRPKKPNPEKLSPYECGEEPIGSAWHAFPARYYIIALVFLLFDVEIVFLFPWATIFGKQELHQATQTQWTWFAFTEMFIFIAILGLGLAYVWAKGYLDWVKPKAHPPESPKIVPKNLYEAVNEKFKN